MAGAAGAGGGGYTLWGWGAPNTGNLGLGNTTTYNTPQQVGDLDDWTPMVAMEANHTHAIKSDGTLWFVGGTGSMRGDGSNSGVSSPIQIGSATNWTYVGAGYGKAYATNKSGELWVWGTGAEGALGTGNTTTQSSMVQVAGTTWAAAAGSNEHTIALRTDGTIWGWGNGGGGRTWHNNTTDYSSPVQGVGSTEWWGPRGSVDQADGWETGVETAKTFGYSQGYWHSMCIDENGKLWGAGGGVAGSTAIAGSNTSPRQVGTDTTWTNLSCHAFGGVGINDGTMTCWGGYNFAGEFGANNKTYGEGILIEWDGTATDCAKGSNLYYQATNHTIQGGTIYFCGQNASGSGGKGNNTNYSSPVQGPSGSSWVKVVAGETCTMGVKKG